MAEAPVTMESEACERDKNALHFIENVTKDADQVQSQVLSQILTTNAHTEYLTRFGLDGRTDRSSFKKCVPVITYEDVKKDILRIANGDTSPILSANPISEFLTSSGTSGGERKLIPMTEEDIDERRTLVYALLMPVMNQYLQGLDKGIGLYFLFIKEETTTAGGLAARTALTSYYKSRHFKHRHGDTYNVYTSPHETILCPDGYQSMYSQLFCGLLQRNEVFRVGSVFPTSLIRAMRFLEEHWREMCREIATGTLNEEALTWDPFVRDAVTRLLHPNPELAEIVERECSKQSWKGIISRLWPNTKYIDTIVTGAMAQYIPTLDYYSGGLPLVSPYYASSECYMGINLQPLCKPSEVSYTLLPHFGYFEFLPLQRDDSPTPDLIDLVDVQIGQEYEIVLTTYAGEYFARLYRYRIGDVLRVTGFHNAAPQFRFVGRKNVMLSIDSDKIDEEELRNAVEVAAKHLEPLGGRLADYTSHTDISTIPAHYVLFWELQFDDSNAAAPTSILEECCFTIEQSFNSVYRQCRVSDKSIGPLEIRVVEHGTFDKLMDYAINQGSSMSQYKTPRCVKWDPLLDLLNSKVTASYFNPNLPKWSPGRNQ
eukprot:Gb_04369 [translate_table: standard]